VLFLQLINICSSSLLARLILFPFYRHYAMASLFCPNLVWQLELVKTGSNTKEKGWLSQKSMAA